MGYDMSLDPYGRCHSVPYDRLDTTRMRSDAFKLSAVFFKSSLLNAGRDFIEAKTTFLSQFKVKIVALFRFSSKEHLAPVLTQISPFSVGRDIIRAKTAFLSQT